ncbi:hypothetical protein TI05_10850, partial [Achromatium sp. WMS3]
MDYKRLPDKQGLYDPANEHDACGVGFIADIKNRKSHKIIQDGLKLLDRLTHRGAVGADPKAGDGAGILVQIPDAFFRDQVDFKLPIIGKYGVGHLFLPQDAALRQKLEAIVTENVITRGQKLLGWRDVPVDNTDLGASVLPSEPIIRQVFIGAGDDCPDQDALERLLFVIRKQMDNQVRNAGFQTDDYYVTSMSSRTIT